MASPLMFGSVIALSLVLGASFSLPISRDLETVQLSKILSESDVTERAPAHYTKTVHSLDEDIKPVPNYSIETVLEAFTVSFEAGHVKRIKRAVFNSGSTLCPSDTIEYKNKCWTQDQYDQLNEGDEYEAES